MCFFLRLQKCMMMISDPCDGLFKGRRENLFGPEKGFIWFLTFVVKKDLVITPAELVSSHSHQVR